MAAKRLTGKAQAAVTFKKDSRCILLFEDIQKEAVPKIAEMRAAVKGKVEVLHFPNPSGEAAGGKEFNFEQAMLATFGNQEVIEEHVGLIVADQELSQYSQLRPATGETINTYAKTLGIPVCFYERDVSPSGNETLRLHRWQKWSKSRIIINQPGRNFGIRCNSLFRGFELIRTSLASATENERTPAILLSVILGRREMADRIAQYGGNEQGILEEIASVYDESSEKTPSKKDISKAIHRHLPRILGNWLLTSLLRYPGILLDETACAAYLGVTTASLKNVKLAKALDPAAYRGPFMDLQQWWWRDVVDDIVAKIRPKGSSEELVKWFGVSQVKRQVCADLGCQNTARYVCMISGKSVCGDHSRGGISWFPAGADLARVSKLEFDKIGPFIGMY